MSFSFEDDAVLESVDGSRDQVDLLDRDMLADYSDIYDEEDFIALGLNPSDPTVAKPGSEAKVVMLAARYAAGLPLWHDSDCYDHGPNSGDSNGDGFGDAED